MDLIFTEILNDKMLEGPFEKLNTTEYRGLKYFQRALACSTHKILRKKQYCDLHVHIVREYIYGIYHVYIMYI